MASKIWGTYESPEAKILKEKYPLMYKMDEEEKILCPICGGELIWDEDEDYYVPDTDILCLKARGSCSDCDQEFSWEEIYQRIKIDNITPINEELT